MNTPINKPNSSSRPPAIQGAAKAPKAPERPINKAPSGPRPDRANLSGEQVGGAPLHLLSGLTSSLGKLLSPPARPEGAPPPAKGSLVQGSPTLEKVNGKMKEVRRGEKSNSYGPAEWLRTQELQTFAKKGPTASKDPGGNLHPEEPPRVDKSEFATRVREQQKQLGDWILKQPARGQLDPADIYEKSLELNRGDAFNAHLTAHNLMKDVTASERGAVSSTDEIRQRDSQIESRLQNLRESNDPNRADKMGPWYHLFGIGLASAAANGTPVGFAVNGGEMAFKQVPRTGTDPGKTATDAWAAKAFD